MSLYYKKRMPYSTYQEKHRRYYESHKEEIARKESDKKRWLDYYERNKDDIKAKRALKRAGHRIVANSVPTDSGFGPSPISMMWVPTIPTEV